jgi:hypothetical protein
LRRERKAKKRARAQELEAITAELDFVCQDDDEPGESKEDVESRSLQHVADDSSETSAEPAAAEPPQRAVLLREQEQETDAHTDSLPPDVLQLATSFRRLINSPSDEDQQKAINVLRQIMDDKGIAAEYDPDVAMRTREGRGMCETRALSVRTLLKSIGNGGLPQLLAHEGVEIVSSKLFLLSSSQCANILVHGFVKIWRAQDGELPPSDQQRTRVSMDLFLPLFSRCVFESRQQLDCRKTFETSNAEQMTPEEFQETFVQTVS